MWLQPGEAQEFCDGCGEEKGPPPRDGNGEDEPCHLSVTSRGGSLRMKLMLGTFPREMGRNGRSVTLFGH